MSNGLWHSAEEDLYSISWSNPTCSHLLCAANVLDYFCDLSNPFYDRQCNNEVIRMQRLSSEQLLCMTGVEFYLHHAQDPILFVIRKQQRLSRTQVTPLAYYYVINGTVLQAPDLASLLNSRLLTTISGLNKVLQALAPCARYHPSDGSYSWDDPNTLLGLAVENDSSVGGGSAAPKSPTIAPLKSDSAVATNLFQVQRTDFLLAEWANRFPLPSTSFITQGGPPSTLSQVSAVVTCSTTNQTTSIIHTGSSASSLSAPIKEEAPAHETGPLQSKASIKTPVIPGIAAHSMSIPPTAFPPSPKTTKKPRVF